MPQPEKVFTLDEANRLLGQVAPLIHQLQGLQASLLKTERELEDAAGKLSEGNGYPVQELKEQVAKLTQHQLDLAKAFESALQQMEHLGCVLKDLNAGLVDFYSLREGETVFLCWKLGEERIRYWHTLEDGFAGRQPL